MSSSLIWFHLYDAGTGQPYKGSSVDAVSCSPGSIVLQFRDAVYLKNSSILTGFASSQLLVYKNKAAFDKRNADKKKEESLKSSAPLDGLGHTEEEALIVVVPVTDASNLTYTSVADKLTQLGVIFTTRDLDYLLMNDPARYLILKSPGVTIEEAQPIMTVAKSMIKSVTQNAIGVQHSIFLDGPLNVGQGQAKSSLYYAFSESGGVFVAKVYDENKKNFMREVEANQAFDHKNLVKFIKTFSIQEDKRHVIVMPFFPRSVADWLTRHTVIPLNALTVIARNCFDALCHLHSKGFCYADLKPANIMLQNTEPGYATLVDYGATVRLGSPIIEFSHHYCLDADTVTATEHLDWTCLGATLAQIGGVEFYNYENAADLIDAVNCSGMTNYFKRLIVSCLQSPSEATIELALNARE